MLILVHNLIMIEITISSPQPLWLIVIYIAYITMSLLLKHIRH